MNEGTIRQALQGADLQSHQSGGASIPVIERYVRRLEAGDVPPPIHVDTTQDVIIDGVHRYIAGRLFGKNPPIQDWPGGDSSRIVPWDQFKLSPKDWGQQVSPMIQIKCNSGANVTIDADRLAGASLERLNLHRAILDGEDLTESIFMDSDLRAASLDRSVLRAANLTNCTLINAWFVGADCRSALFTRSRAIFANFSRADLSNADMSDVDIEGANFSHSILFGTNMTCLDIESANFDGSRFDDTTKWPVGFDPISKGAIKEV